ncbi:MAG: cell wall metabolism sensor histidine kinase WalK [Anaerolineales bacterium]|nr:cell wall metabolism sensor histidine kinase WalK [Anaerolineales bacterium]MCX7607900.1 cell wall metabolism sensor histidine kinase WalK [Anaerolineales bacterium]
MNWLLGGLGILSFVLAAFLAWKYFRLLRHLSLYTRLLQNIVAGQTTPESLPSNVPGLATLSNAVRSLTLNLLTKLEETETQRAELSAVLDRMTDGVLIANSKGRIQLANPAAEMLFETGSVIGKTVAEVIRHHQLIDAWRRAQSSGEEQSIAIEIPTRKRFLQLFVLPDRPKGICLLLVQDLTRLRRLETVRRDFISNVSHELRTPLASLKALTETLRDGALEDPEAARRFLNRIETEVDALSQMAAELLELTRIESGQAPLNLKSVAAARLLEIAADRMRAQAERAGLSLTVEVGQDLPYVRADASRLEQVLVNLIHNAVKFTPPGGEVRLSAIVEGPFVRFSVQDTGVGISAEDLPRVFERFYKSDRARSGGGTGLGLSIAKHIVEAHGGRIWAESVEGQGSIFYFTVPVG